MIKELGLAHILFNLPGLEFFLTEPTIVVPERRIVTVALNIRLNLFTEALHQLITDRMVLWELQLQPSEFGDPFCLDGLEQLIV